MLEKEFQYYVAAQPELVKKYDGQHLVIVGDGVVGSFTSRDEALNYADGRYTPGTFLIQLCTPGDSAYTRKCYSRRVRFNGDLMDVDVLIGMDVISMGDFALTAPGGHTKFSFKIPSSNDIDFRNAIGAARAID